MRVRTSGTSGMGTRRKASVWCPAYRVNRPPARRPYVRSGRGRPILVATTRVVPRRHRPPTVPETTLAFPEPITFEREFLARFELSSKQEWLETNGLGGYASSTAAGASTRQYHGLLVVPHGGVGSRYVMLAKVEETFHVRGRSHDLACNRYPGVIHPRGHLSLAEFRLDPIPTYVYEIGRVKLEKRVFMLYGTNTVVISYRISGAPSGTQLTVRPMVAARPFHTLAQENRRIAKAWRETQPGLVVYRAYPDTPALRFSHGADAVVDHALWYRQSEYDMEASRGLPFHEDLYVPVEFSYKLRPETACALIVSTDESPPPAREANLLEIQEKNRRTALVLATPSRDKLEASLASESARFLISAKDSCTGVLSGYHWFGEYCRDTLISLPGLTLVNGKFAEARDILSAVSRHFSRGMLPNGFDESTGKPEYTSVDAPLWFICAVHSYLLYTADYQFVRDNLYGRMVEVIEYYRKGTGRGVVMARDGLIEAGTAKSQMTWMNVRVADEPVTPRHGKAVEVEALWYNALKIVADLARKFGDDRAHVFATLATVAKRSFQVTFWNEDGKYLYDCVQGKKTDASVRPNQIIAVCLPHPLLERDRAASVVDCVGRELRTPFGLRTLSPQDPRYRGRYEGDAASRDEAYHQGTVWAWLLGPFITAYLRVHGRSPTRVEEARGFIEAFRDHLRDVGLGTVSELFDGDPPHTPRGCISKALSVAELLRAYREDILGMKPDLRDTPSRGTAG